MNQNQQSQLKDLITKGKEQGFLTYGEVNDHLPDGIVEPEQIEDIVNNHAAPALPTTTLTALKTIRRKGEKELVKS